MMKCHIYRQRCSHHMNSCRHAKQMQTVRLRRVMMRPIRLFKASRHTYSDCNMRFVTTSCTLFNIIAYALRHCCCFIEYRRAQRSCSVDTACDVDDVTAFAITLMMHKVLHTVPVLLMCVYSNSLSTQAGVQQQKSKRKTSISHAHLHL
jgi:hypothetical protein